MESSLHGPVSFQERTLISNASTIFPTVRAFRCQRPVAHFSYRPISPIYPRSKSLLHALLAYYLGAALVRKEVAMTKLVR